MKCLKQQILVEIECLALISIITNRISILWCVRVWMWFFFFFNLKVYIDVLLKRNGKTDYCVIECQTMWHVKNDNFLFCFLSFFIYFIKIIWRWDVVWCKYMYNNTTCLVCMYISTSSEHVCACVFFCCVFFLFAFWNWCSLIFYLHLNKNSNQPPPYAYIIRQKSH